MKFSFGGQEWRLSLRRPIGARRSGIAGRTDILTRNLGGEESGGIGGTHSHLRPARQPCRAAELSRRTRITLEPATPTARELRLELLFALIANPRRARLSARRTCQHAQRIPLVGII